MKLINLIENIISSLPIDQEEKDLLYKELEELKHDNESR